MHAWMIIQSSENKMDAALTVWMQIGPNHVVGHNSALMRATELSSGVKRAARRDKFDVHFESSNRPKLATSNKAAPI